MNRLPSRIAAVMIGTILIFVLMVGASVLWLTGALDSQAHANTERQVRRALEDLLGRTEIQAYDYAKWDEATRRVAALDLDWFDWNFGASAVLGEAMQLAVVWGGPLAEDLGWVAGGGEAGRAGLIDPTVLGQAEHRLAEVPLAAYEGTSFFAWHGGDLFAMAAARIELPEAYLQGPPPPDAEMGRLLMGQRIDDAIIQGLADSFLLTGLRITDDAAPGSPFVPLMGGADQPVAYLAWDPPRPGTTMLRRMAPPLLAIGLIGVGLAGFGMVLVRRSAQRLVVAERQASVAARTDALTGLPNRAAFAEVLAAPARAGERAVLFLDVNDFKRVNDSIGHEAGDQVIVCVAGRLNGLAGPDGRLARIAGDEFVFVVAGPDAEGRTRRLADRVRHVLAEPFSVLGHQMRVGMAMGYAVQASNDMMGPDLVRQADLAMYEAKRHKGQGQLVAFSAVIEQASQDALVIERGLRRALARPGELAIAYQPIVGADNRLARAEALARWTSPELGPVPPDRFIAVAEQAGLIVELGRQLFQLICKDLAAHPDLAVSVNISTLQLMAPDFIPLITGELASHGIDPGRVEIELTEAVVMDDAQLAAERLRELHAAGFSTALDDFGTGYSSVGYLEQLDFQTLKIDRSFVSKVRASAKGIAVVQGMITMAHGLDLRVVCEGVETAEELDLLRELGCDLAQGYHLDRPLPIQALAARWLGRAGTRAAVA